MNRKSRSAIAVTIGLIAAATGPSVMAAGNAPQPKAAAPAAPAAPKETGLWYDDTGDGAVKIEMCGAKLCGRIYWLKNPLNAQGQPLHDKHNPDESQRTRTICGLPVVGNLAKQDDGTWDTGWVYDPKEGKSYSLSATLIGPDKLEITGYLGLKLLGKSFTWTRAPAELPACLANAPVQAQGAAAKVPAPAAPAASKAAGAAAAPAAAGKAPAQTGKPAAAKASASGNGEALPWSSAR